MRWTVCAVGLGVWVAVACWSPPAEMATGGQDEPVPVERLVRRARSEAAQRIQLGQNDEAVAILSAALGHAPTDPDLLCDRARLYMRLGFLRAAEGDYERALEHDPQRIEAWLDLGRLRLDLELPRLAAMSLGKALELGAGWEAHQLLGRAYRQLNQLIEAANHYQLALAGAEPEPPATLLIEAASLAVHLPLDPERRSAVLELVDQAGPGPDSKQTWFLKALLLEGCGRPEREIAAYVRALEIDPHFLEAWTNLALAAFRHSDPEQCLQAVERALELETDPKRRRVLERLAESALEQRSVDEGPTEAPAER